MNSSKLNVLMTCIGGVFALDIIEALRLDKKLNIRLIGADANPDVVNRFFVDSFYSVPNASKTPNEFVASLLDICQQESVDIVIPSADEEVLAVSRAKQAFLELGIKPTVEEPAKVELIRDKARLFTHLSSQGVPLPKFVPISNAQDILRWANYLQYPDQKFILKPISGRGARNLIVVDSKASEFTVASSGRGYGVGNLESVVETLRHEDPLALMAMEYLLGPAFDVDCVAKKGQVLSLVVRRRLWKDPFSPMSQGCRIEHNEQIEQQIIKMVDVLSLNGIFDFDFATAKDGTPGLLEINPRWSGAVGASVAGGVNIPSILVRSILGRPIPNIDLTVGMCMFPVTRMGFTRMDS